MLRFDRRGERTVMSSRHSGPLLVQKALYPEGHAVCHALLIHPPGGIAGGDALAVDVDVQERAHALITTPGATRWYKANGALATQDLRLRVAGVLEWLPQEAIVYDGAQPRSSLHIELQPGAATIGWDQIALGRAASGEQFAKGSFRQSIRLSHDGVLVWHERTRIDGSDAVLHSPVGLSGRHVFGCMWAWRPAQWSNDEVDALRADCVAHGLETPVTRLAPQLLVARQLAASTAELGAGFEALWRLVRPRVTTLECGERPRIWAT